jgi:type II secretory pathway predicted ATPase ExeA
VSAPDVIDLRAEGLQAMDAFGEEPAGTPLMPSVPDTASSMLTYERYYGLREKPFSLATDPRFLYRSGSHTPVLDDLGGAIRRREGLIVLTGEIGTGKTTLCRAVLSQLDRRTFATFVPDPFVTREDLLKTMLIDFGVMSVDDLVKGRLRGASRPDLSYPLYDFLESLDRLDACAVLVIDEAQNVSLPLLEEIRILSDLEVGRKLLQVVLVGQPEFDTHLQLPRMRQIRQRVTLHCTLRPLDAEETHGYVTHRLKCAGAESDQVRFTHDAMDLVHAASQGLPRAINVLCDRALLYGSRVQASRIDVDLVRDAMRALRIELEALPFELKAPVEPNAPFAPVATELEPTTDEADASPASVETSVVAPSRGNEDLFALLDLPTVDIEMGGQEDGRAALSGQGPSLLARGKVWAGAASRLRPVAVAALVVLGGTTGVSLAGYVLWLKPLLTAAVALPEVERPGLALRALGPLVLNRAGPGDDPSAPREQEPPRGAAVSALSASPRGEWAIQTGAFTNGDRASALVARLTSLGLPAYSREVEFGGKGTFRVALVGPFATSPEADAVLQQVRRLRGLEQSILRRVP